MRFPLLAIILVFVFQANIASGQALSAPDPVFRDLRGRRVRISHYRGKVVLLNFWATWCPPCRKEMPGLIKIQREYGRGGLQVIGITYPPQRRDRVRSFVRRLKVNYPIVFGSKKTKALFDKSDTLPITVIIDRDGNVRDVIEGILFPEEFEQKIKPLLHLAKSSAHLRRHRCNQSSRLGFALVCAMRNYFKNRSNHASVRSSASTR